jgi:hypothetical protein
MKIPNHWRFRHASFCSNFTVADLMPRDMFLPKSVSKMPMPWLLLLLLLLLLALSWATWIGPCP